MYSTEFETCKTESTNAQSEPDSTGLTAKITTYLRWSGSLLIILSAVSFMLQGYEGMLPAYRYWVALAFTLLLCGSGMICAYLFRETKGARIFFGLAMAFLTVQVSQVGAMIYGHLNGHNALQPDYTWLQFMEVSPSVIAIDFILTAALLLLVSYAGFAMLARRHLKTLLTVAIIGNAVLMLPIRDDVGVPLLLAGLLFLLRKIEAQLHQDPTMQLLEGFAARAILWLPALIIMGRSMLHPMSFLLAVVVLAWITIWSIHDVKSYSESALVRYICQWLGTASSLAIWLIIAGQISSFSLSTSLNLFLPLAALLFALSAKVDYHAKAYRCIASVMVILITYGAMLDQQPLAPVMALAAGIALSIAGLNYREKLPFFAGNVSFAGGFLFYCRYAVDLYAVAPWGSSIALGLVVILLASYLEKREIQILEKSRYYYNELKSWQ